VLPWVAAGLGYLSFAYLPDSLSDFFFDKLLPFGITFWLGTFFAYGWEVQRFWIQELPRKWAPWATGAAVVFVLLVLGGPGAIFNDPWVVGMIVFPGVRMWMSYRKRRMVPKPRTNG